jgi:inosine-uridine nucleoside N-ribohydrolase
MGIVQAKLRSILNYAYATMEKLDVPRRLWIDTDIALGAARGDVDDGWALATLIRAAKRSEGKIQIIGISVCDGNTDAATALDCAKQLLMAMQQTQLPLVPRAEAAAQITRLVAGSQIVALGPLTNIAAALDIDATLAKRTSIVTVGGVLRWTSFRRRLSDLNAHRDRNAATRVQGAFPHIQRYPLDVIDQLKLDAPLMARIANSGAIATSLGEYLAQHSARWLRSARWRHGRAAFPVWDLVAALGAIDQLPGAAFDDANRLIAFDAPLTWAHVASLLAD